MSIANPFSSADIEIAKTYRDRMDDLQSQSDHARPFPRMIDVWWAGLCLGLREDRRSPLPDDKTKFATGVIFDSDPWRIAHLQLIALATSGPEAMEGAGWANRIVATASEYANGGLGWLFDTVSGAPSPVLALYRNFDEVLH